MIRIGLLLLLSLCLAPAASAEDVVIYRCTDPTGALTIQNMPCPKGMQQQKKVMQAVQGVPAYVPAAAMPAPTPVPTAAAVPPAETKPAPAQVDTAPEGPRLPPPPIYQCSTRDNDSYLTESDQPQSRCVPLRVTGLDGDPRKGAGQACEVMRDTCARVPDGKACDAWAQFDREAESHWRFAEPDHVEMRKQQYDRIHRIVTESTCGAPATPDAAQNP